MKQLVLLGILSFWLVGPSLAHGQDSEFYKKPTNPAEFWRALQFEIGVGKYDIALTHLKGLLDANPTDADLLAIEAKDGLAAFLRLRNVERWSRDKALDKEARANVEKLIQMVSTALKNELSNPARITKYVKNLTGDPEESAYAIKELTRSGVEAIPVLIDLLRANQPAAQRAAILNLLPLFDIAVVPALAACLDAADASLKLELLDSLRRRPDYLSFSSRVETDLLPYLWHFSAPLPNNPESLQKKAKEMLRDQADAAASVDAKDDRRLPQKQLTEIARTFLGQKARFTGSDQVNVWKWDGARPAMTAMTRSDAEEYFGLRYARWALEIAPDFSEAQQVFVTLALEKHFARAGTETPLAKSSPSLYAILATAPYDLLTGLTESYLREKRVALAVALLQAIGDRGETRAARPSDKPEAKNPATEFRPSLLLKAMDYPDRRVRLAAVEAILKTPNPHVHQRGAQIVKILAGYLQAESPDDNDKPKALIGDPDRARAELLAGIIRQAGFRVETVRTGKDLMRRLQTKTDVDLIVLDHHIPYPMFADTATQVRADFRSAHLPLLVVASPDQPTTAHPVTLLGRLAALAAAEEHVRFQRDQKFRDDPARDSPANRFKARLDVLRKSVDDAGIRLTPELEDRLEYLVYLTTPAGEMTIPIELEQTRLYLNQRERADRMKALATDPRRGHLSATEPPFADTAELTPKLAEVVARYENALPLEMLDLAKVYWQIIQFGQKEKDGRVLQDPLPGVAIRHYDAEAKAKRLTKYLKNVRVIPEVFTDSAFKEELQGFFTVQDPKQMEADKKSHAKSAMEWLRKMVIGELPGYSVIEVEATLRQALQNPELAALAVDAVARLPGREAQEDIANVVLGQLDPAVRAQAADALVKHIQQRGKMLGDPQSRLLLEKSDSEADPQVKVRLLALRGILQADAKATGARLLGFTPIPVEAKEKKEEPKN